MIELLFIRKGENKKTKRNRINNPAGLEKEENCCLF